MSGLWCGAAIATLLRAAPVRAAAVRPDPADLAQAGAGGPPAPGASLLRDALLLGVLLAIVAVHLRGRWRQQALAQRWLAATRGVWSRAFALFPSAPSSTTGGERPTLRRVAAHLFELRATGSAVGPGALARIALVKRHDLFATLLALGDFAVGPLRDSVTIDVLLERRSFAKFEFGFVRATHERDVRRALGNVAPTLARAPADLPADFVAFGDRGTASLFRALFGDDAEPLLGLLEHVSYFRITDRFVDIEHKCVLSLCVMLPSSVSQLGDWSVHAQLVGIALAAAARATGTNAVQRPSGYVRSYSTKAASADKKRGGGGAESKRKQRHLELQKAAHERKQKKRDALLRDDPAAFAKLEELENKRFQKKRTKILR